MEIELDAEKFEFIFGGNATAAASEAALTATGGYIGGDVGAVLGEAIDPLGGGFFGYMIGSAAGSLFGMGAYDLGFS